MTKSDEEEMFSLEEPKSAQGTYNAAEYVKIISKFDFVLIANLKADDYVDFGIMDSKKYAAKLFRIVDLNRLDKEQTTMVLVLATAVKNKKRILNAMKKFKALNWYGPVLRFFQNATVQYTFEEEDETISVVHFASCVPFIAARIWLQITKPELVTVQSFLENLWAAQLNLSSDLMDRQKKWETMFWTDKVKKGGKNFEKKSFNDDYWKTKATDTYVLLDPQGGFFGSYEQQEGKKPYEAKDIEAWLETRVSPKEKGMGKSSSAPPPPPPPSDPKDTKVAGTSQIKKP
jgi:hypothetical protein